mmetsp:Transcript_43862/g.142328  ORF Transcript_43862/g.142328 Transcript_43862/m.142328 type:complete len:209 (-) Transcript_43862:502-1128(-)
MGRQRKGSAVPWRAGSAARAPAPPTPRRRRQTDRRGSPQASLAAATAWAQVLRGHRHHRLPRRRPPCEGPPATTRPRRAFRIGCRSSAAPSASPTPRRRRARRPPPPPEAGSPLRRSEPLGPRRRPPWSRPPARGRCRRGQRRRWPCCGSASASATAPSRARSARAPPRPAPSRCAPSQRRGRERRGRAPLRRLQGSARWRRSPTGAW